MTPIDLQAAAAVLALLLGIAVSYAVRAAIAGPAHFARVDAAGGSLLLGKRALEMGYWALQPVARACVWGGLSADGITRLSLGLAAAAGLALSLGHPGVGGALAAASGLGDALDGLVARSTGTATRRGGLFDAAVDRYGEFFIIGGVALHHHGDRATVGLALFALLGSFMVSYGSAKAEALGVPAPRGAMRRGERAAYLCGGALLSPFAGLLAERADLPPWIADAPLLCALALVGLVANVSAVRRLNAVGRAVGDAPLGRSAIAPPFEVAARAGTVKSSHDGGPASRSASRRTVAELARP
jgi:CDP-diacylglycerol--glycerol-3-phosphate 3-phosphatidyltransferase